MKIEHEKKLSALQSVECKGGDEAKVDKTKASITRLQSLIVVTSQAVSTTSDAINALRDAHLVPQLLHLCRGYMSAHYAITSLFLCVLIHERIIKHSYPFEIEIL